MERMIYDYLAYMNATIIIHLRDVHWFCDILVQ